MSTLIGTYGADISIGLAIAFVILSFIALVCFIQTAIIANAKNHYRHTNTVRYLLPFVCLVVSIENAGLATTRYLLPNEDNDRTVTQETVIYIMMALQTTEVPILLLTTFDVCYLIHKRRSVNFCCMLFDEGHRVIMLPSRYRGFILRHFFRGLAFLLLILGIVVNFTVGVEASKVSEQANKAGWGAVIEIYPNINQEPYLVLSLVPETVLIICSFYLSLVLWRYGTNSSMEVHSVCNPWFSLFFGTISLFAGQCFDSRLYPFTSNLGLILFIFSVLLLMYEVDKDMDAADDFADFLKQAKYPAHIPDGSDVDDDDEEEEDDDDEDEDEDDLEIQNSDASTISNESDLMNETTLQIVLDSKEEGMEIFDNHQSDKEDSEK